MEGIFAAEVAGVTACVHAKVLPGVGSVIVTVRTSNPDISKQLVEFLAEVCK